MLPELELEHLRAEYERLGHAVQSGIDFRMCYDSKFTNQKHMRTGIDMFKSDMGGLAHLLIQKGLITELEYMRSIVDFARREKESYEQWATEQSGTDIKFG